MPFLEKIIVALTIGFVLPYFAEYKEDSYRDSAVFYSTYALWCLCLLPGIQKKLNVKLLWDIGDIFLRLFMADVLYFGIMPYFQKNIYDLGIRHKSDNSEMRFVVFFMGAIRLCMMLFCFVNTIPQLIEGLKNNRRASRT